MLCQNIMTSQTVVAHRKLRGNAPCVNGLKHSTVHVCMQESVCVCVGTLGVNEGSCTLTTRQN